MLLIIRTLNGALLMKNILAFALFFIISGCASILIKNTYVQNPAINKDNYETYKNTKGVVLIATTGKRSWACGSYENAELRSIGFDLLSNPKIKDSRPDLVINNAQQAYINSAYLLEAGTYMLSYIEIKVANSISDVRYLKLTRDELKNLYNQTQKETFTVKSGETVYIGHFGIDCTFEPTLWRYYIQDQKSFDDEIKEYKEYYPYLNLDNVSYRLFNTKQFGYDFTLKQ